VVLPQNFNNRIGETTPKNRLIHSKFKQILQEMTIRIAPQHPNIWVYSPVNPRRYAQTAPFLSFLDIRFFQKFKTNTNNESDQYPAPLPSIEPQNKSRIYPKNHLFFHKNHLICQNNSPLSSAISGLSPAVDRQIYGSSTTFSPYD
jgi:hypothetical protein